MHIFNKRVAVVFIVIFFFSAGLLFGFSRILVDDRAFLPSDFKRQGFMKSGMDSYDWQVVLYSRGFAQGDAVYIEVRRKRRSKDISLVRITRYVNKGRKKIMRNIYFAECGWGYRAFMAIDPEEKPGKKIFEIETMINGKKSSLRVNFNVRKASFAFSKKPLDLGKYSDLDYSEKPENIAFIKQCWEKKKKVFRHRDPDRIHARVSHPRNMHYITSPFWAKRTYMKYRIIKGKKIRYRNRVGVHRGLDLRGNTGEPVFSIAAGRVALAEEMFYEGNFVIIDHGNKIFSYYMHLDSLQVRPGDLIRAGAVLGRVGSSGVSTAAHLHVSLMIRGVQVDPLSILPLPLKN